MKYLLVTGGEIRDYSWFMDTIIALKPDKIIAVDSGADLLSSVGVNADILLGDLDSISEEVKKKYENNNKVIRLQVEKDDTDTSAALFLAIEEGAEEVYIIPGVGGCRFDHSYANLLLLNQALDKGIKAYLLNENNKILLKDKSFTIKEKVGTTVSFFAMFEDVDITLEGFYYPLNNYHMKPTDPIGISNKVIKKEANVKFDVGIVMVIISID